ncbi:MAG: Stf0 family sulfotransferase [Paracoccus sp. (in: a-proteobacteria)]|uniref:Stf0 family sulfotransferase n=1 Tax=Paracoccus sp. TaxID=267 RepID=UPI0026DF1575|nr:Stf0 family sulfotransferase [Paracoccus sp. (in: a-proteobacteria)]MDO5620386.1 Stf0 family sulfotransferase [Paracoccus sp. (in: a-proteobacteria)]
MSHQEVPQTAFVIVAQPRSGSTLLASALNEHPKIICHDEVFAPDWVQGYRKSNGETETGQSAIQELLKQRKADPEGFLFNHVFLNNGMQNGFKVVYSDLFSASETAQWLRRFIIKNNIRIIHLRRSNMLRCFISLERMRHLGVRHSNNSRTSNQKLTLSLETFTRFVLMQDGNADLVNMRMNVIAQPRYEQMPQGYNLCLDALGLKRRPFIQNLKKLAPDSLGAAITNPEIFAQFDMPRSSGFIEYAD